MLADKPVRDFLDAVAAPDPTPGGGSVAALAAAAGASLLLMVARLPKTRHGSDDDRHALRACADVLVRLRAELVDAVDADTAAYDGVTAAYRMPKGTASEQTARKAAIQQALRRATDVPLTVMRLAAGALGQAPQVAAHGHAAAASDTGVGVATLAAGLRGAGLNVDANLDSLTDLAYVEGVRTEERRFAAEAERSIRACEALGLLVR